MVGVGFEFCCHSGATEVGRGATGGVQGAMGELLKAIQKSPCSWFLASLAPQNVLASPISNRLLGPSFYNIYTG